MHNWNLMDDVIAVWYVACDGAVTSQPGYLSGQRLVDAAFPSSSVWQRCTKEFGLTCGRFADLVGQRMCVHVLGQ